MCCLIRPGSEGCLYNLTADITEHHNLADAQPDLVAKMAARIRAINATVFSPQRGTPSPLGCQVALTQHGGFWGPFITPGPTPPPPPPGPPTPPYNKACGGEMAAVCPLASFTSYAPCRACLKAVETTAPAKLAGCKPAAPDHFRQYCCSRFPHPADPHVSCTPA